MCAECGHGPHIYTLHNKICSEILHAYLMTFPSIYFHNWHQPLPYIILDVVDINDCILK